MHSARAKPRVVLAEGDALHAAACRAFLVAEGIDCKIAISSLDCLEHLRQGRPDVLVLDADLPWGSVLGAEGKLDQVPVLVLADRPGLQRDRGLIAGESAFLLKPVSPVALTATVTGILAGCRTRRPAVSRWRA
jgi:DNA-binding response OmpR family regulator